MDVRQKTIKNEIRDILKSYYFTEWEDDDDCINTLMPKIEALISQNYIPKERVLTRGEIEEILMKEVVDKGNSTLNVIANALLNAGSIGKVGVEDIEKIIQKEVDKIIENGKSKGKNPTKKLAQAIKDKLKGRE